LARSAKKLWPRVENCKLTGSIHVDVEVQPGHIADEFMQAKNLREENRTRTVEGRQ
jgi:hypothetical protein